jgi:hypothetical protein
LSIFNSTEVFAVLPALSIASPVITCPVPSVVTVVADVHEAMPEVASSQVNVSEYVDYLETKMHSTISEEEIEEKIWDYLE